MGDNPGSMTPTPRYASRDPIPLLDLAAQHVPVRGEIEAAIARVLDSQRFVMGAEVEAFEREFADYCCSRFAVGCASGSDALLLALMALEVGPGDEVICPAYTFFATASAIARLGARPVFADIDPASYNLDVEAVRHAARGCERLSAILPVDLFGRSADLPGFAGLAHELGVPVVEDPAQAIGANDTGGQRTGSRAAMGCFSLYPTKNLGALGDAGVITTNDPDLSERLASLREHGAPRREDGTRSRYTHERVGVNSRLDAIQAAVLRVKLRHLETWTERRRENAAYYDRQFSAAGAVTTADKREAADLPLQTPHPGPSGGRHVYNHYAVRVPAELRDPLRRHLESSGIASEIYYPLGLHLQPCFAHLGYREGELPETEAAARESLVIPVYPGISRAQLDRVVEAVVSFLSR